MAITVFKIINKQTPVYLHDLVTIKNSSYSFRYNNTVNIPGSGHNSDSPLFRQPIFPTSHYSDSPLLRQPIIPSKKVKSSIIIFNLYTHWADYFCIKLKGKYGVNCHGASRFLTTWGISVQISDGLGLLHFEFNYEKFIPPPLREGFWENKFLPWFLAKNIMWHGNTLKKNILRIQISCIKYIRKTIRVRKACEKNNLSGQ